MNYEKKYKEALESILFALAALMMAGCMKDGKVDRSEFVIVELDTCEYIKWSASYGYQHKGNCKFCKERRQKELKELITKLKEK